MFLWCVQEVAELKEEDIISHTTTAIQLPTAAAIQLPTATAIQLPSGDHCSTLSELYINDKNSVCHTTEMYRTMYIAVVVLN